MNERFMDLEELDKYGQKLQTYSDYVNDSMNKIAAGFNNLYSEKIIQGRRANVFIEVYKEMDDSRKNVIERLIEIKRFVDNVKTSLANMDKENAQRLKNAIENMGLVQPNSFSKKASTNPLNTNINKEKKESYFNASTYVNKLQTEEKYNSNKAMFNNESFSIKDLFNKTFKKSDQDKYQGSNLGLRIKESIKVDNQEYTLTVDTNRVPTEKEWNEEKIAFIKQVATPSSKIEISKTEYDFFDMDKMASNVFGIKYNEGEYQIALLEKAIEDLYINVELIDKNTTTISKDTWVGRDADAYQEKILSYSNKLKNQTDSFKQLVETLKQIIKENKEQEENSARGLKESYSYNNEWGN